MSTNSSINMPLGGLKKRPVDLDPAPSPSGSITSTDGPPRKKARKSDIRDVGLTPAQEAAARLAAADQGTSWTAKITKIKAHLKENTEPQTLAEIAKLVNVTEQTQLRELASRMQLSKEIGFNEPEDHSADFQAGTYFYLAKVAGVNDRVSLLQALQELTQAKGIDVKDLKDGWPECEKVLREMESNHEIIINRTKKDNKMRYVFRDDPKWWHEVSDETKRAWNNLTMPSEEEMYKVLREMDLKPTGEEVKTGPKVTKKEKKKTSRQSTKVTNKHMDGLLKDYSMHGRRAR